MLMPPHAFIRLWPLPALAAWAASWVAFVSLRRAGLDAALVSALVLGLGAAFSLLADTRMRAIVVAAGFPLSLLAQGAHASLPSWIWLLPLALLAAVYPLRAWRDAPLFPTPADALVDLPASVALKPGARVLDAGCGLGHGLAALRRAYPQARLEGIEWSWPLALLARARCPGATVRRGDMWAQSWQGFDLVYLFQRPESMAQALAKAQLELAPGAWLASLEFEASGWTAHTRLTCADGRPLWLYRMPAEVNREPAEGARKPADVARKPAQAKQHGADKAPGVVA